MSAHNKTRIIRVKNQAGFTLLELLIAISILCLIMGIIYGVMYSSSRAWDAGEARAESNQRLRLVLNQLAEEIRSAYSIKMIGETPDDKYLAFWGEPDRIRFVTVTAGLMSEPLENKLRALSYYVDGDEGLAMKETALNYDDFFSQLDTQEAIVLNPEIAGIDFRYYYVPEEEENGELVPQEGIWSTEWDPTDKEEKVLDAEEGGAKTSESITARRLPDAVEITLTMKPEREDGELKKLAPLIVPILWGKGIKSEDEALL